MRRLDYNRLGPAGFRELCHAVLLRVLGPTYRPFSAGGADGQRDGTFKGQPLMAGLASGYWVAQFKHHDVENVGANAARTRFLQEAKVELKSWAARRRRGEKTPDTILFVTNALATGVPGRGTFDKFDRLVAAICKPRGKWTAMLWDKAKLDQLIDGLPDVQKIWLPLMLENAVAGLGVPQDVARDSVNEQENAGIEIAASATYSEDWKAIVAVVELGNGTKRRLTIREAHIAIEGGPILGPDNPRPDRSVNGVPWQGPDVIGPFEPDEFSRFAWQFGVGDSSVADALKTAQPLVGKLVLQLFPRRTLVLTLPIYTITRQRELQAAATPTT